MKNMPPKSAFGIKLDTAVATVRLFTVNLKSNVG
jgi:hypothetical protein